LIEHLTIGTRGSALALVQSHWVRDQMQAIHPGLDIHILIIQTEGDASQVLNTPLASFGEKGIFAKELEVALLAGTIDVAVHSMKDLATDVPAGLHIGAVPKREDVRDAILGKSLFELKPGDRVGTGSVRRRALLQNMRPDLRIVDIRGNVDTRISKLKDGQFESIVLAVAGLSRLGRTYELTEILDPTTFVPDVGQGALAVQTRFDDSRVNHLVSALNHFESNAAVTAERSFLEAFGGGCQTPVGAWAAVSADVLHMVAMAAMDGAVPSCTTVEGSVLDPTAVGKQAANRLNNS
jgi:hydroxymethylbilane synthase